MATIKYTIEPSWSIHSYSDVIEVDDEELEGLSAEEREKHISEVVQGQIENLVSWGWEEDA
jgi:hypothetical protein